MYQAIGWMLAGFFITLLVGGVWFYSYLLWEDRRTLKRELHRPYPNCAKCNGYPLTWITNDDIWREKYDYLCQPHHNRWCALQKLERDVLGTEWERPE